MKKQKHYKQKKNLIIYKQIVIQKYSNINAAFTSFFLYLHKNTKLLLKYANIFFQKVVIKQKSLNLHTFT